MKHRNQRTDKVQDFPIDIVIPWVDDADPLWRIERDAYLSLEPSKLTTRHFDAGVDRFRSWDNLEYVLRSIEKNMPWVRTVHLVTNGQIPGWLDIDNLKLNFVRHEDYIPHEYLPTFNSHVIELNLHRIKELSEHFIYFNDDTFVIRPMKRTDFFNVDGLPRDQFGLWRAKSKRYNDVLPHVCLNNMSVLNQYFNQRKVLRSQRATLLDPRNGVERVALTMLMSVISRKHFANLLFHHMPAAFVKQSFRDVWKAEPDILNHTSSHRFRSKEDVSQHIIRAWQMVSGKYAPRDVARSGEHFTYVRDNFSVITQTIASQRLRGRKIEMFCVSDEKIVDFERAKREIKGALQELLPEPSTFEISRLERGYVYVGETEQVNEPVTIGLSQRSI